MTVLGSLRHPSEMFFIIIEKGYEKSFFQNKDHEVYTSKVNRNDDKRLVLANQISTLARGHHAAGAT